MNELVAQGFEETKVANPFTMDDDHNFVAELTERETVFCSMTASTNQEKAKLFAAMNNPEHRLGDCINMVIKAKDIFCEVVNCTNRETGESRKCPRIVIIDEKGEGYQAVSLGVFSAMKKLIAIYGAPTWSDPIPLKVKQISKGTIKMLTFDVAYK